MIPPLPNGTAELVIKGLNQDLPWAVVQHAKAVLVGTPTAADAGVLAQRWHTGWAGQICGVQNDQITLESVECTLWHSDGLTVDAAYSNPVAGEDTGVPLDASACVLVSLRVDERWKGGHPRSYIPGVSQDRLDGVSRYTGATVTDYQDAFDAYLAYVNGASSTHIDSAYLAAVRRFADRGSLAVPKVYLDPPEVLRVTSGVVRSHVASQRRRLGRF